MAAIKHADRVRPCDVSAAMSSASSATGRSGIARTARGTVMRQDYKIGSAAGLDDTVYDTVVLDELEHLKAAKGTIVSRQARVRWWTTRCAARKLAPWPLSPDKVKLAAALLKRGGYRSAPAYLYAMKRANTLRGHAWSGRLQLEMADAVRATTRGLGPPAQAAAFDILAVAQLVGKKFVGDQGVGIPRQPIDVVLVASWWLLRELELSTALTSQLVFVGVCGESSTRASVEFHLPISKTDPRALGKRRSLACTCPFDACPVAAARRLVRSSRYEAGFQGSTDDKETLLVQDHLGRACTKQGVAACFRSVARAAGHPCPDSISGHSGRITGAQMLSRAGIPAKRVALFGRWGSHAVFRYIRDSDHEVLSRGLAEEVCASFRASGADAGHAELYREPKPKVDKKSVVKMGLDQHKPKKCRRLERRRIYDGVRKILKRAGAPSDRPIPALLPTPPLSFFSARGGAVWVTAFVTQRPHGAACVVQPGAPLLTLSQ